MAAYNGGRHVDSTDTLTGESFETIVIQEDTVFTSITGTNKAGATINFQTEQFFVASRTLKQGALFATPKGTIITAINLASGSLIAYNTV